MRRRRFVLAILVAPALSGCAVSPPVPSAAPVLPPAPANFGKPVTVRDPKVGEDARLYAARERAARLAANVRLTNDAAFYAAVAQAYGGK